MLTINRVYQPDCTLGVLNYQDFRCFTLELPDLDNAADKSCIPAGRYQCYKFTSAHLGECIEICNVLNRSLIRIHSANFTSDLLGCVAVGDSIADINKDGIPDVTDSKNTLKKLLAVLPDKFEILIK